MITEQQLDDMARDSIPGTSEKAEQTRHKWKDEYRRMFPEMLAPPKPAYVGNPSLPAERIQNGLQYQEEMIMAGLIKRIKFDARPTTIEEDHKGYDSPVITIDYRDAREHFRHVHALIANTATQQAYRQELEFITGIEKDGADCLDRITGNWIQSSGYSGYFAAVNSKVIERKEHLTHCLAELEAQFADLEQKIFGTDKPPTDEETAQAGKV